MENVSAVKNVFWRTDTKALIGGVVMGVAFVLVQQVAHRIDAVIWPTLLLLGAITWATFTGLITLVFRQPAGIIMGETQALIAVATGLSPLAVFFIPANGLASLAFSSVAKIFSMEKWSHHLWAQLASNVVGNICVGIGLKVIFHLPIMAVLISSAITIAVGAIGGTILTKVIYDSFRKAGFVN